MFLRLSKLLLYIMLLKGNVDLCATARILVVLPVPSHSHQIVFQPYTQELAKRGHEVIVITPKPIYSNKTELKNLTEIDVFDDSYKKWQADMLDKRTGYDHQIIEHVRLLLEGTAIEADSQFRNYKVKLMIEDKNQRFDLVITEECARPAIIYSNIYKVPLIQISSFGAFLDTDFKMGLLSHPILYPSAVSRRTKNLSLWEKITEIYYYSRIKLLYNDKRYKEDEMLQNVFGMDTPSIEDLYKNVDILLLNANPMFDAIKPLPKPVINLGPLHIQPVDLLPKDLKSYLDSSKNGVIYISFGTSLSTNHLPNDKINVIINAVTNLSCDVLWKWDGDNLPGKTKKIKISKWLPQAALLQHPNIKLFITQGGLQSTEEAIAAGVPLIGIPMLADQWFNADRYENLGIGQKILFGELNEEVLEKAINEIIGNKSYSQNIIKLRELIRDEPDRPLDRAVKWTEYVLKHTAKHLRCPAANMTWFEYFEIELLASVIGIALLVIILMVSVIRLLLKMLQSITVVFNPLKSQ